VINPQRLFERLAQEDVEIVLVGGVAMIAHGIPHVTNDIDLCYRRDPGNMDRLIRAIASLNPRLRVEGLTDDQSRALPFQFDRHTLRATESLTLTTDIGGVDLLARVSGLGDYENVRRLATLTNFSGITIPILSLTGLIENKRAAARDKDLAALPQIEATLRVQQERVARTHIASEPASHARQTLLEGPRQPNGEVPDL